MKLILTGTASEVPLSGIESHGDENPERRVTCTQILPGIAEEPFRRNGDAAPAFQDHILFGRDGIELEPNRDRTWK